MFGAIIEALIMALYRIIKGEAQDAAKPVKGTDLGPPPPYLHSRWNDRVRDYLRDKKSSIHKGE